MPRTPCRILTGPAAAALLGLDGYRDLDWPEMYCAPRSARTCPGLIRVRTWLPPSAVGDVLVAQFPPNSRLSIPRLLIAETDSAA